MEERNGSTFPYLIALSLTFALLAAASVAYGGEAAPGGCDVRFSEVLYSARFRMGGSEREIWIGKAATAPGLPSSQVAVIRARSVEGGRCEAICQVKSLVRIRDEEPGMLQLQCRDAALGTLTTPAAVIWADASPLTYPVLRFGTWLSGYQHARLTVAQDGYAKPKAVSAPIARR